MSTRCITRAAHTPSVTTAGKVADPKARHWGEQAGLEEQKCFIDNPGGTGECGESGSGPGEP